MLEFCESLWVYLETHPNLRSVLLYRPSSERRGRIIVGCHRLRLDSIHGHASIPKLKLGRFEVTRCQPSMIEAPPCFSCCGECLSKNPDQNLGDGINVYRGRYWLMAPVQLHPRRMDRTHVNPAVVRLLSGSLLVAGRAALRVD
jgi:hypothetical protein